MKRIFVIAALATFATAANAQNNNAAATTTTSAAAAPAAGATVAAANGQSSTAVANPEDAVKSNLSLTMLTQVGMDSSEAHYTNRTDKSLSAVNLVGIGYKLNKDNRIGFKQYFNASHDGETKENKVELDVPVLTFGHSWNAGVAKSEPLSTTFWYYVPTTKTFRDSQSNGTFRADTEIVWTLNPKVQLSYFLSPRQSIIPTETTIDVDGKATPVYTKTSLLHFVTAYYNVNDDTSFYVNVGMNQAWKTRNLDYTSEKFVTYLGASFNFLGGKLNINPEIDYEVALPRSSENVAVLSRYQESNLSYLLTAAVVF